MVVSILFEPFSNIFYELKKLFGDYAGVGIGNLD